MKMKSKLTFEASLARLGEIVEKLESGGVTLEESLKLFEEGAALAAACGSELSRAEQKIRTLTGQEDDADGKN